MMRMMTPMITQSEAPACPPASLPKTAAEALAVVVLLKRGLLVVDVEGSSIGGLNGGFFVDGFGSASERDQIRTKLKRVSHLVVHLGWVDFDLDVPPSHFCQIPHSPGRIW